MEYGTRPSMLDEKVMEYHGESVEDVQRWGPCAITVRPEIFLESLVEGKGLWPSQMGAEAVLKKYKEFASRYAAYNQNIMPPQDSEDTFLRCMEQFWGKIEEKHLILEEGKICRSPDIVVSALGMMSDESAAYLLQPGGATTVYAHPFMDSNIYRIYV